MFSPVFSPVVRSLSALTGPVSVTGALSTTTTLGAGTSATIGTRITSYNGITTAGQGVVVVAASARATAQIAAVASVAAYTVGAADGTFIVSANVLVTTSTTHTIAVTCAYTDESNVARTLTLPFIQLAGAALVASITNVTGAGPYEGCDVTIRAKAGTTITIATSGTFTTVTYNVEGLILQAA